jgi:hypothetical protein
MDAIDQRLVIVIPDREHPNGKQQALAHGNVLKPEDSEAFEPKACDSRERRREDVHNPGNQQKPARPPQGDLLHARLIIRSADALRLEPPDVISTDEPG